MMTHETRGPTGGRRRMIVVGVIVLLVLAGVSGYYWSSRSNSEIDAAIARKSESYTCPHCGFAFELSVEDATAMLRSNQGILCPQCGRSDAEKARVEVAIGGFARGDTDSPPPEEDAAPDRPAAPVGGARKKGEPRPD